MKASDVLKSIRSFIPQRWLVMTLVATPNWYESSNFLVSTRLRQNVVNLSIKWSSTVCLCEPLWVVSSSWATRSQATLRNAAPSDLLMGWTSRQNQTNGWRRGKYYQRWCIHSRNNLKSHHQNNDYYRIDRYLDLYLLNHGRPENVWPLDIPSNKNIQNKRPVTP